jgi:hypothetical protein
MRDQGLNTSNNWLLHFLWKKKPRKKTLLSQVQVYYNTMLMKSADFCFMQSTVYTHTQACQYGYDLAKQKTIKECHEIEFKYLRKNNNLQALTVPFAIASCLLPVLLAGLNHMPTVCWGTRLNIPMYLYIGSECDPDGFGFIGSWSKKGMKSCWGAKGFFWCLNVLFRGLIKRNVRRFISTFF